jgi:hypothetical protein
MFQIVRLMLDERVTSSTADLFNLCSSFETTRGPYLEMNPQGCGETMATTGEANGGGRARVATGNSASQLRKSRPPSPRKVRCVVCALTDHLEFNV